MPPRRSSAERKTGKRPVRRARPRRLRTGFLLAAWLAGAWVAASIVSAAAWGLFTPPGTPLMTIRIIQGAPRPTLPRRWRPLTEVAPALPRTIIASEDAHFCDHFGIDFSAIRRVLRKSEDDDEPRGASTITQQLVKNLYFWPHRSYLRKGLEAWMTLWVELFWSKRRIMEVYLNSVEWGEGVFGVDQAARTYFRRTPARLTAMQAARLTMALPNPRKRAPDTRSDWLDRRARLFAGYAKGSKFDTERGCP